MTAVSTSKPSTEPWVGYDGQETGTIRRFLSKSGSDQARAVLAYEQAGQNRPVVVEAAERRLATMPA